MESVAECADNVDLDVLLLGQPFSTETHNRYVDAKEKSSEKDNCATKQITEKGQTV